MQRDLPWNHAGLPIYATNSTLHPCSYNEQQLLHTQTHWKGKGSSILYRDRFQTPRPLQKKGAVLPVHKRLLTLEG